MRGAVCQHRQNFFDLPVVASLLPLQLSELFQFYKLYKSMHAMTFSIFQIIYLQRVTPRRSRSHVPAL